MLGSTLLHPTYNGSKFLQALVLPMGDIKTYNIGNIENAQFINQSLDYQDLTRRIEEKQELIEAYQLTGKTDKALKAGAELEALEQQLEQFKADVLRLYETFTKIEINSERLAKARAYFRPGAISRSRRHSQRRRHGPGPEPPARARAAA
jgi:hypothetical protein